MQQINRAVAANDHENMMKALKMITTKFDIPIYPHDASFYLKLLKKRLFEKEFDGSELWLDDVKAIAKTVTSEIEEMQESKSYVLNVFSFVFIDFIELEN